MVNGVNHGALIVGRVEMLLRRSGTLLYNKR